MIKLYFTDDEMKSFLLKLGYTIKKIKTWTSYNTYHNQVEDSYSQVEVAFKDDTTKFDNDDEVFKKDTIYKFELNQVFHEEIKNKLLSL